MNRKLVDMIFSSSSSSESDDEKLLKNKRIRKCWVRPYYQSRDKTGAHLTIVQTLCDKNVEDPQLFKSYMRMTSSQFENLLLMVEKSISKQTYLRDPISSGTRLAITIRYLATGESQQSLSLAYKCSPASIHNIIKETTVCISDCLKKEVFPKLNAAYFNTTEKGFEEKWNFPHCIGAIDGKHVMIQAPAHSGSEFFNYKKSNSIVLLAICDFDYKFVMCDIGASGCQGQSDGGIFRNSEFGKLFYSNGIDIPESSDTSQDFTNLPYVFVADDAFSLTPNMLKPYAKNNLTLDQRVFNYRLSRARRMIENTFGILVAKWRIFRSPINANVGLVEQIIEACVCLHNWLRIQNTENYILPGLVDNDSSSTLIPGSWRSEKTNLVSLRPNNLNSSNEAKIVRNKFAQYFVGSGAVE